MGNTLLSIKKFCQESNINCVSSCCRRETIIIEDHLTLEDINKILHETHPEIVEKYKNNR